MYNVEKDWNDDEKDDMLCQYLRNVSVEEEDQEERKNNGGGLVL